MAMRRHRPLLRHDHDGDHLVFVLSTSSLPFQQHCHRASTPSAHPTSARHHSTTTAHMSLLQPVPHTARRSTRSRDWHRLDHARNPSQAHSQFQPQHHQTATEAAVVGATAAGTTTTAPAISTTWYPPRVESIATKPGRSVSSPVDLSTHASASAAGRYPSRRKRGRKTAVDIEKDRKARARSEQRRQTVVARYSGVVVAQSEQYEFIDGRFFFPRVSIRWELFEETSKIKHFNPMGRAKLYDFVLHNDNKSKNKVKIRIKGAAMSLFNLRGDWKSMEGYTCFWKGVKLTHKTDPPPPPVVDVSDEARLPRSETEGVFDGLEANSVSVDTTEWSHDVDVNMGMNASSPRGAD